MPSYTPSQRASISQFVNFTQAKESIAARFLKSNDWNVERALDSSLSALTETLPALLDLAA
ncbi:Scaffold-type E3 ligase [Exophiala dermatitidis]|nr:Scaffold-type E3 ligase [Exophiala dermatitidis]